MISFMFECVLVHYESNKFLNTHEISLLITAFRCAALQPKFYLNPSPVRELTRMSWLKTF